MAKCGACGGSSGGCGCVLQNAQDGTENLNPSIQVLGAGTPANPFSSQLYVSSDSTFVPVYTGLTIGAGGTNATAYRCIGKEVTAIHVIVLGTSFVLPTSIVVPLHPRFPLIVSHGANRPIGVCNLEDVSAAAQYSGVLSGRPSVNELQMNPMGVSGVRAAFSPTVPFTWAAGDKIEFLFKYTTR